MTYKDVSECALLYILVAASILIIALICVYFWRVCVKKAKGMGISPDVIQKIVKSSGLFAIVPSIAVAVGLVALVTVIGRPYAWFRLTVIGSVTYETMAANMALAAMKLDLTTATAEAFGMIMWLMCIPISCCVLADIIVVKPIHMGSMRVGGGDKHWGPLAQSTFMTAMMVVFIVPMLFGGLVGALTFATSAVIALLVSTIAAKTGARWLNDFTLAFSLIGAMAMSVVYTGLIG